MRLPQGLVQVYTGPGKGKTTAAVGQAVRAAGAGLRVCFIQFLKGGPPSSEQLAMQALGEMVRWETFGRDRRVAADTGQWWLSGWSPADQLAAEEGWAFAAEALAGGGYDLVVLDELAVALEGGLVETGALLAALAGRPAHVEVVITGRGAPAQLVAAADLVTEMHEIKHPFRAGLPARKGIEF